MGLEKSAEDTLIKITNSDLNYHVPTCFEKCNYKVDQTFLFRVTHLYDPSKFWITPKYKELEVFQKYIFRSYYLDSFRCAIPFLKLKKNMYCVVLTDGCYFRGIIVGFPSTYSSKPTIQVHLVDYGMVKLVDSSNIFYMTEKVLKVPKFAIRASLGRVCPKGGGVWTSDIVHEFTKYISNKVLHGLVVNVDLDRQLLEIHMSEKINGTVTIPIHKIFIKQKRMQYTFDESEVGKEYNVEKPYLFPSHEALESGKVPLSVDDAKYQKMVVPSCSVLQRYFKSD